MQNLGQSYGMLLVQQPWEVDAPADTSTGSLAGPEGPSPTAPPPPLRIIEALLFVGGAPLSAPRACETIRGLTPAQFIQAIDQLNLDYRRQGRPYVIQPQGEGYVLSLRPGYKPILARLYGAVREVRLSTAAIDVLALVAYRQPASKQEIDSVRGAESGSILRQLVRRGLIAVVHRGEAGQSEVSYGTTDRFLQFFGLKSLDDLPRAQDLQSV